MVKEIINDIKINVHMDNKNSRWEFTKCKIRSETLVYASQKSKRSKQEENEIQKKLEILENNLEDTENKYDEYIVLKSQWEQIQLRKNNGIIMRSKAKWVEEGKTKLQQCLY